MKIKKKMTRKQFLKQDDEFLTTSARTLLWIKENYNKVILALILVFVAMIIIFSIRYRNKTNLVKSNRMLSMAKGIYYASLVPPNQNQNPDAPPQGFTSSKDKYTQALQLFQELLQVHPDSPAAEEAKFFIPNCLLLLGNHDEAIKGFNEYVEHYPNGFFVQQARVGIGYAFSAKGDTGQSIAIFQRILEDYPEYVLRDAVYMQLGKNFEEIGSLDKAKEAYQNIVINFPNSPFLKDAQERLDMLSETG